MKLASTTLCSGCSACFAACPKDAITMVPDAEGFLRPQIDETKCVQCHACERACPVLNLAQADDVPECYAARNQDEAIRLASSSGGLFTAIAKTTLAQGGVVFGCVWEKPALVAIHKKIETEVDLAEMRGSKYVQSDLRNTFREAKASLQAGRNVLFSGTPCQIAGLNRFLGKTYDNLLTCDIICHGSPSPAIFEKFKQELTKQFGTPPVSISFRNKFYSWRRCSLVSAFADTSENREDLYTNRYIKAFLRDLCLRPSCYQCAAKGGRSGADITIADFWGVERACPELDDNRGTSLVLVHTEKGRTVWNALENIEWRSVTIDAALRSNPSYFKSVRRPRRRDIFMRLTRRISIQAAYTICEFPYDAYRFLRKWCSKLKQKCFSRGAK